MFRNVLASTLRNLARNRLYAAISILGLAVAMAAAMLTGLYLRDELSFDKFIPGTQNVRIAVAVVQPPDRPKLISDQTPTFLGPELRAEFPEAQLTARLMPVESSVRRGDFETMQQVGWVDPDFFKILPLPVIAGDPVATVARPDGVVITQSMARRYFGKDKPIGETLYVNRVIPLKVGAVIKDTPGNSHLIYDLYPSGLNAYSIIRRGESQGHGPRGGFGMNALTYIRFADRAAADGAKAQGDARLEALVRKYYALPDGKMLGGNIMSFHLVSLPDLHLYPLNAIMRKPGSQASPAVLTGIGLIGLLILLMAGINFVNLMTASASQRMVEVGVRKIAGAERGHLILQFIGEALIYALLGLLLAVAMVELALPAARAVLERPLAFEYWRDPLLLGAGLGMSLLVGLLAGFYPALVQSSFRPVMVLKGRTPATGRGLGVREGLVLSQFAILIGLMLAAAIIAFQTHFVMNEGLKVDKERMVMMDVNQPPDLTKPVSAQRRILCREAFIERVRQLQGVVGASCSSPVIMGRGESLSSGKGPNGSEVTFSVASVDYGFFELYGLKPVAGRFFNQPGDNVPSTRPPTRPRVAILNETAVRALGFASPTAAIGKPFNMGFAAPPSLSPVQIIGVAPDFEFNTLQGKNRAFVYPLQESQLGVAHIKLKGDAPAATLRAIDGYWRETNFAKPPARRFVDQHLQLLYANVLKQGAGISILCGIAVLIGCLGLFGLAAFTAERRTKEIGVRKVMGASKTDIVKLLLWSFTRPVLWANLIAWPVGWWAMSRWLSGFSTRIELSPLFFIGAGGLALTIAALTVSAHAVRIARAKPVGALRYE